MHDRHRKKCIKKGKKKEPSEANLRRPKERKGKDPM